MNKTFSFDVFDTCITRNLPSPEDVFGEAYIQARIQSAPSASETLSYIQLRKRIETEARRTAKEEGREEIEFKEIFRRTKKFPDSLLEKLIFSELQTERSVSVPVPFTKSKIARLLEKGEEIFFISDMYLDEKEILHLLLRAGYPKTLLEKLDVLSNQIPKRLIVSSSVQKTKHFGSVYKFLRESGKIKSKWVHIGDNLFADIHNARKSSVLPEYFPFVRDSRITEGPAPPESISQKDWQEWTGFIGKFRSLKFQALSGNPDEDAVQLLIANKIYPLLGAFSAWLSERSAFDKLNKLFFLSRDGFVLRTCYDAARLRHDIDSKYLLSSRQVWFFASITQLDDFFQEWMIVPGQSKSIYDILKKVYLEGEADSIASQLGLKKHSIIPSKQVFEFFELIKSRYGARIIEESFRKRKLLLQYLKQEGFFPSGKQKVGIVDIGWTLKMQEALDRIFNAEGLPIHYKGYYLFLTKDRRFPIQSSAEAMFLQDWLSRYFGNKNEILFRNIPVAEQLLAYNKERSLFDLKAVRKKVEPLFLETGVLKDAKLAEQYERFTKLYGPLGNMHRSVLNSDRFRSFALNQFTTFLKSPDLFYLRYLGKIRIADDQNESKQAPLFAPIGIRTFFRMLLIAFRFRAKSRIALGFLWTEASIRRGIFPFRWIALFCTNLFESVQKSKSKIRNILKFLYLKLYRIKTYQVGDELE
ncbi:hypothetical protein CH373_12390 [Leptospira perolatii]|uniref:Uncharacterized protein n=1 Tax=Leptospira perolatii TaxID=2023191 RepID=A0A2M9ZL93_9LEPT|nr:hypothetical protein [Leptospira perolatii]PJZ70264.1 hypothetical protein CH360_06580 [Leptospira perolatii]PJZ72852.1 hypothetical protein CH373_12390 [Leptospira perolatii]